MECNHDLVQTNHCCLYVTETRNDLTILQQEVEKLSILEEKCNRKLDEFYLSKWDFENLLEDLVFQKLGLSADNFPSEKENIDRFKEYVEATWQYGADKLGLSQRKLHYFSLKEDLPLTEFLISLEDKMQKRSLEIAKGYSHSYCISIFYSMHSEITKEHFLRLSNANICLRQYFYLKKAILYLENLKKLINSYVKRQDICSLKIFCDEITSGIILSPLGDKSKDDDENLLAFRYVVNLLTGALLGEEYNILDPHSESVLDKNVSEKNMFMKNIANFFIKDELNDDQKSNSLNHGQR